MRAAGCFGASAIYYSGERFERATKYHQDTHKVKQKIPLTAVKSFTEIDEIAGINEKPHKLVCVELVEGAIPLPEFTHPENALYVFGPEDGSITQSLVEAADMVVYIPTTDCLNLAATVNVLLYDRMAKQKLNIDHDALIKNSRDINNQLVINR